jgi:hypothetical protein
VVELIASTTTRTGLTVRCELDTRDCVTSPPLVVRFTSGSPRTLPAASYAPAMFVVTEAEAAAIRAVHRQRG